MNIIYGINKSTNLKPQIFNLNSKLQNTIKLKESWIIISDLFFDTITTQNEFNRNISQNSENELEKKILKNIRNKKKAIIGIKVSDDHYQKEGKLDDEGKCLDCKNAITIVEKNIKNMVDEKVIEGNVFLIIDDIHLRTKATKEYGSGSIIFRTYNNDKNFKIFRPIIKEVP